MAYTIDVKTCFMFLFFNVFLCFVNVVFFVVFERKTYKITNMVHFSWAKTPFPR